LTSPPGFVYLAATPPEGRQFQQGAHMGSRRRAGSAHHRIAGNLVRIA